MQTKFTHMIFIPIHIISENFQSKIQTHVGYKTSSYSAGLSSCSVKHHNFFKLIFLQP